MQTHIEFYKKSINVDAKDGSAKKFYKNFGFKKLLDEENHLYISIQKAKNSMS